MANNSVICGVVVDRKDYDRFALQRFEVPHDFKEGTRSLLNIEQMAKMSDYRKHYPEFAEACQKIVEREKRNIQSYYAGKTGRKEFMTMKHDSFTGYLKDLQEVQKSASKERIEMRAVYDKAAARWKDSQRDNKLSDYEHTAEKMRWLEAEKAYKDGVSDLKRRTDEDIKNIRAEFERHIDDFYSANGDRIDDGVVRLFNSGLKLSDKEISGLVSKNVHNPTMLRVIADHCDKNNIDNKSARIYGIYARGAGKNEREIFEQVVSMVNHVTGMDDLSAKVWGVEKGNFDRLSEEAIGAMAALSVQPEPAAE